MIGSAPRSVIVLDLDDTLYLEREYVESGLQAVGRWAEGQIGAPALGSAMVRLFREGVRGRIFDRALEGAGIPGSPELIGRMLMAYRQHRPTIDLAADARRLFARKSRGTAFALVTDGYLDAQKRKVRALGLHQLGIAMAVCTDRWGRAAWKPSEQAYRHVQQAFGLPAHAFVYIADNPNKDFHAPRRLGWRSVQIKRSGRLHMQSEAGAESADEEIESLDEIAL